MNKQLLSIGEMAGILLLRFPPLARAWVVLLVLVNLASVLFLDTIYGQVAAAAMSAGVVVIVLIHETLGFVRLMGIGHIFWIPMLIWFVMNPPDRSETPTLYWWFMSLVVCNTLCLVIDTRDVLRYVRGEREPYYRWTPAPSAQGE